MKKWELARYLIDAKKCVDSVLYIGEHAEELRYYDLKTLIDEKRNTFYINCCAVIEHTIASKTQQKKRFVAMILSLNYCSVKEIKTVPIKTRTISRKNSIGLLKLLNK